MKKVGICDCCTTSLYYIDPDGNSVELQYDNFDDWSKSSEWMRTSNDFANNPIGVPVDPSKMVVAHNAGASRDDLHRRAFAGEFLPSEPSIRVCRWIDDGRTALGIVAGRGDFRFLAPTGGSRMSVRARFPPKQRW